MKNFYLAVTVKQNGKYFSDIVTVRGSDNLISKLKDRNFITVNICATRKKAQKYADNWNADYKANGTYLFD